MKQKRRHIFCVLLAIMTVGTMIFIWSNSMASIPESRQMSMGVLARLKPYLELIVGPGNVTDHLVRKLAHFAEFGLLGCLLAGQSLLWRGRGSLQGTANCLAFSLAVAVTDETIQIFYDRGDQVSDVVLDFCGAATGVLGVLILFVVIRGICRLFHRPGGSRFRRGHRAR